MEFGALVFRKGRGERTLDKARREEIKAAMEKELEIYNFDKRTGVASVRLRKRKDDQYYSLSMVLDILTELEKAEAEVERVRIMDRCKRHGGHSPEGFCYPCHAEDLIKTRVEIERLRGILRTAQNLISPIGLESEEGFYRFRDDLETALGAK